MTVQERLTSHQKYLFSVDDFLLLDRSGAFREHARTELIEGEILAVNAIQTFHAQVQASIHIAIAAALRAIGGDLITYLAPSIPMGADSVPEPDIVVGLASSDPFLPLDKLRLAIEISDSTLTYDLGRKAALYARHGVPEYWVADVNAKTIHQMWAPEGETYAERREIAFGERIDAIAIAGLAVETAGL
jgi:Uma2 family endonuclease